MNPSNNTDIEAFTRRRAAKRMLRIQQATIGGALMLVAGVTYISFQREKTTQEQESSISSTQPFSAELSARQAAQSRAFEDLLVARIRRDGYLSITIHVALLENSDNPRDTFRQASHPETNLVWGALYGIDTHFPNAAKWKRILSDKGDGSSAIIRRSIFKKTSRPTEHWAARGIDQPFDVYVLALAWDGNHTLDAMQAPVRDALCNIERTIDADGRQLRFGGDSVILGYAGENVLLEKYTDPVAAAQPCNLNEIRGIFYLCSRSAIVLHLPLIEAGFQSILFTRGNLPPEAYAINGILDALLIGDLDRGFTDSAAAQYARYQKRVDVEKARALFYR